MGNANDNFKVVISNNVDAKVIKAAYREHLRGIGGATMLVGVLGGASEFLGAPTNAQKFIGGAIGAAAIIVGAAAYLKGSRRQ